MSPEWEFGEEAAAVAGGAGPQTRMVESSETLHSICG